MGKYPSKGIHQGEKGRSTNGEVNHLPSNPTRPRLGAGPRPGAGHVPLTPTPLTHGWLPPPRGPPPVCAIKVFLLRSKVRLYMS